ncbi:heat shock 70 kDa protein 12B-like [Ruditapes philippinarum]|uniref:heat shock 70 kDa protein 12B-like n=1 Tax=Ruditapes philippinarum TaxID=129788 RepID=UPI00295AA3B7|nr:heat shock 70 kDa protein 12B-like [Ruditapes philippinarum]
MSDTLMVIAIDIGTSYSSGFYSFRNDPKEINAVEYFYDKVPTVVLFDKRKEFHSFGYKAVDNYKQLSDEEKRYWYYFKDFHKISNEHKPTELEVTECSGKRLETYKVYGSIIKYFTDTMLTKLRRVINCDIGITRIRIHVVLIVPPVFSRSNKSMLQKAFHTKVLFSG